SSSYSWQSFRSLRRTVREPKPLPNWIACGRIHRSSRAAEPRPASAGPPDRSSRNRYSPPPEPSSLVRCAFSMSEPAAAESIGRAPEPRDAFRAMARFHRRRCPHAPLKNWSRHTAKHPKLQRRESEEPEHPCSRKWLDLRETVQAGVARTKGPECLR